MKENSVFKYGVLSKSRVEAFSDGIFAIIVTLLILELRVPHIEHVESGKELLSALGVLVVPKIFSWVISFLTICIVWVNHHRILEMLKGFNIVLFWLNVQVLLFVCFVPFPTALVGDYPRNPVAVASYGLVMGCAGAALVTIRLYGLKHRELLKETVQLEAYKKDMVLAFIFGPVLYITAAALAFVHTYISFAMYFLVTVYFMFSFVMQKSKVS
jgi:uncharacterized membrane protein